MTRTQKCPLLAPSTKFKSRKRKTKSNTRESDIGSENAIITEFHSTTQISVNTILVRLKVETLNSVRKLNDFNSVCVKIETDEWNNTAADFYSAFAKSEQVLGKRCIQMIATNKMATIWYMNKQDVYRWKEIAQNKLASPPNVKLEQTECEVMHQDVIRQACVNSVCVNKNTTANSNVYTAQDEPHSVFGKTKLSLNLNTDQSFVTTTDLNYEGCIAKQCINTDMDNGNTTANNHNALCDHTYSKTPENQAKLADPNSAFLTREEIELSNVDQYCTRPTAGGETMTMDHYSNPNVPKHSNSDTDDSENAVTRKPAKMKLKEKDDRVKKIKIIKKTKTSEEDKTEYSLQERNPASRINLEPPDNDHFLYCGECNKEFEGDCPGHGPYIYIQDKEVPEGDPLKADNTLPDCLEIKTSKIAEACLGVFSKEGLESRIMFGPYGGFFMDCFYCCKVQTYKYGKASHFVDAQNKATSNWMRYVNCAMTQTDRNLVALQHKGRHLLLHIEASFTR